MKKFISLIAVALLLQSCYKDKGNYSYRDIIEEITIEGIPNQYRSFDGYGTITPRLLNAKDTTLPLDESNFSYKWIALINGQTIAETRNLEQTWLNLTQNSTVRYQVTDKAGGKMFQKEFTLIIQNPYSTGYLIMTELDGKAMGLDMLSWLPNEAQDTLKYQYIPNLLAKVGSELPPLTGPFRITNFSDNLRGVEGRQLCLLTESGTYRLNPYNFSWKPEYAIENAFITASLCPAGFMAENIVGDGSVNLMLGKGSDGKRNLYSYSQGSSLWYTLPINTVDKGKSYFTPSTIMTVGPAATKYLVFDDVNKSLHYISTGNATSEKITAAKKATKGPNPVGEIPSWDTLKMDLKFAGANTIIGTMVTKSNQFIYAILKDKNNDHWLLRFYTPDNNSFDINRWHKIENAPNIANAEYFAVGGEFPDHIYYSVGSKVYEYNMIENLVGQEHEVLDVSTIRSGDKITYLSFINANTRQGTGGNDGKLFINVGSYNEGSKTSTFESYSIPALQKPFEIYSDPKSGQVHRFTGIAGKIVDVCYK